MSKISIDDIKAVIPSALVYEHYLMARCLFHDDRHPSMLISTTRYSCKSCGASGSLKQLMKHINPSDPRLYEPVERREAIGAFPPYSNLSAVKERLLQAHDRLVETERLNLYLKSRCLDDLTLKYELGWWENWYTIPVRDRNYSIIGGVARASSIVEERFGRFDIPIGQPPLLYVPDWTLWESAPHVFITYGMFDALSVAKLGFAVGTPTSGKDSMNPEWLSSVRKPIYIIPDRGEEQTAKNLITKLGFRGRILLLPYTDDYDDPNSFLCKAPQILIHELEKVGNE